MPKRGPSFFRHKKQRCFIQFCWNRFYGICPSLVIIRLNGFQDPGLAGCTTGFSVMMSVYLARTWAPGLGKHFHWRIHERFCNLQQAEKNCVQISAVWRFIFSLTPNGDVSLNSKFIDHECGLSRVTCVRPLTPPGELYLQLSDKLPANNLSD